MKEIARVFISGDDHLCSKNRGVHNDYPAESLNYYKYCNDLIKHYGCTHAIGLGDFTYGRFSTLEYRNQVEDALAERQQLTNGNYYMIQGNHDVATYGMTEYEFYRRKKLFRHENLIQIGNVNINLIDYGTEYVRDVTIENGKVNIILAHGYYKFKNTQLPNYGQAIELDEFERWYGAQYLICGHIHNEHIFKGNIVKDSHAKELQVHYVPCLSRPDYKEGEMPTEGCVVILQIFDNGQVQYNRIPIQLLPLEESFNLALKDKEEAHKEAIKVDVSDVVEGLDKFERCIGNPEDVIMAQTQVDEKYRKKAIELLQNALK